MPACAASVKLMYEPQPTPARIAKLGDMTIRAVACGSAHVVALNDKGEAFSWGELCLLLCGVRLDTTL